MALTLGRGEPPAGPWRVMSVEQVVRALLQAAGDPVGRPRLIAIDGRGGSGKTTICERLHRAVRASGVVHTDDVAWHLPFFAWGGLLVGEVLGPLRRGEAVSYTPGAHYERSWPGTIDVPAGLDVVFVEGTGIARRELCQWLDAVVWVQSDVVVAQRRGIEREGGDQAAVDFWHEWMADEVPFLQDQRPWERADLIVCGSSALIYDPATELVVAPPIPTA